MWIHKFWVLFSVTMFNLTVKKSQHADSCIWVQLVWVYVKHISTQLYIRVKRPHWNTCRYRRTLAYQHDYSHRLLVVAIIWFFYVFSFTIETPVLFFSNNFIYPDKLLNCLNTLSVTYRYRMLHQYSYILSLTVTYRYRMLHQYSYILSLTVTYRYRMLHHYSYILSLTVTYRYRMLHQNSYILSLTVTYRYRMLHQYSYILSLTVTYRYRMLHQYSYILSLTVTYRYRMLHKYSYILSLTVTYRYRMLHQ